MITPFGSGVLYLKAVAGNLPANPTPVRAAALQDVTIDVKGDTKTLYGQGQFPIATARGKIDISIKGKLAAFDMKMWNQIYFSQTVATGVDLVADQEPGTIPSPSGPYTIQVTNHTNFLNPDGDQGVQYASNGQQLDRVASGPTTGQYSVAESTGTYTFAAADTGLGVLISYLYTSSARGVNIAVNQQNMGFAPEVELFLYSLFRGKYLALRLYDVTLGQVSFPTKLEDFWMSDFDGKAFANAAGQVMKLYGDLS